jgi:hypothetical protein
MYRCTVYAIFWERTNDAPVVLGAGTASNQSIRLMIPQTDAQTHCVMVMTPPMVLIFPWSALSPLGAPSMVGPSPLW